MVEAVVVEAVRSPIGKRGGALAALHPVDLLAQVLRALVDRVGLDASRIEDVICGCVTQVGEQGVNLARSAALAAGFPESVPGVTIDRQCGSSLQAVDFAAQAVLSGAHEVVIACGVESMSRVPMGASFLHGPGQPFGEGLAHRYPGVSFHQGQAAELIAERWGLSREAMDAWALESHRRALVAQAEGRFAAELCPIALPDGRILTLDEGPRPDTSLEKLAALKPAFREGGLVTAGSSSQISDGASAVLVMSRHRAERLGLRAKARLKASALVGGDPEEMLSAPIPATAKVLRRAGLELAHLDRVEINEAFASVVLAWLADTGADPAKVNPDGGAIALGHPLGASGARLVTSLVHGLERTGGRYGLVTMCEGGGMANAALFERLS